jgi:hypothetical protein
MSQDYPSYPNIETQCEVRQSWTITSPQLPGVTHVITSVISGGMPSDRARYYAADMADKVAKLVDWGGGGS